MTLPQRTVTLTSTIVILLATGLAATWAQEAEPQPPAAGKVAFVDISTISSEYQALQEKDAELKAWLAGQGDYLQSLQVFIFLAEDNFNEVLAIVNLPKPIPAEKVERLDELEALSLQKEQRFLELQSKSPRTTAEADKFSVLREGRNARLQQLAQLEAAINQQYQERITTAREELMGNVEQIIAEYAQENGYDIVLDRAFVLYGGEDITRAIIDRLNPAVEPAPEEEAQPPAGEEAEPAPEAEPPPAEETEGE